MRRSKTLIILLAVLAVLIAGAVAVSKIETHKEIIRNSDEVFFSVEPEEVTALSWTVGDSEFSFTRSDSWVYDEDSAFPVNEEKISELLEVFHDFGAAFIIDEVEDESLYGIDDPEGSVTITAGESSYTVLLGDYSVMDSQRYVSIGDGKVYLVSHDPVDDYTLELSDLILNDAVPEFDGIADMSFGGSESYTLTYEPDSNGSYCEEDVYYVDGKPLDSGSVSAYLDGISGLVLNDYVTYKATDEDLESCFLAEPDLTVTVNCTVEDDDENTSEGSFTFSTGCDRNALAEAEADGDTSEIEAYLRMGDSPIIYRISADDYNALMAYTYNDLRHTDIISASFDDILQIDVTLEGEDYSFVRVKAEDEDEDDTWTCGEEEISVAKLRSALSALSATEFTEKADKGKQEIYLTLYLDNENFPEIALKLYRYDGESCVAELDGEIVALVSRSQAVNLIEAVNSIVLGSEE